MNIEAGKKTILLTGDLMVESKRKGAIWAPKQGREYKYQNQERQLFGIIEFDSPRKLDREECEELAEDAMLCLVEGVGETIRQKHDLLHVCFSHPVRIKQVAV